MLDMMIFSSQIIIIMKVANVMAVQEGNIKTSNDIDSTSMPHNAQAIKEMTTEILLNLTNKETGEQQIVNGLIDTDAPED
jgi:hypothetical protein